MGRGVAQHGVVDPRGTRGLADRPSRPSDVLHELRQVRRRELLEVFCMLVQREHTAPREF